jgi:archaellum component FlaC
MEAMRQSWTDDRLDEFGHRIDERFDRVDERFDRVDERFKEVDRRFNRIDNDIGELRKDNRAMLSELHALQRTMLQVGGGLIAAVLSMMVAVIGLVITQL